MHYLITGGSGLIGQHLIPALLQQQHQVTVVTRTPAVAQERLGPEVNIWPTLTDKTQLNDIDVVINLAGEPIADKRWSEAQKQRLCDSRWKITQQLSMLIKASSTPPSVMISGSACGYYGNAGDATLTEEDQGQDEFTHHLCSRWEQLALEAESDATRVCLLRTGVVLARSGGALSKMALPFRLGIGGPLGNGRQYMPWIHIQDMVSAILWLIAQPTLSGPFNLVAPYAVRNEQFSATLGRVLHRPAFMRTPASAIRLMMGESSVLVLGSQHVLPVRLEASGFQFRWYDLEAALQDILST